MKSEAIKKLYYSITQVAQILGEEQHVLRYWEREFTQLKPAKNRAGNRVYTTKDLGILRVIKRLLREEGYTVAGAKEYLRTHDLQLEVQEEAMERKAAEELLEQELKAYRRRGTLIAVDRLEIIEQYRAELLVTPEAEELIASSSRG